MFGKLFKPRAHYVFDYKPRYYNERKERLEDLKNKYNNDVDNSKDDVPKITISKSNLRNDWVKNKRSATDKATNLRLAIIIALLIGITAYVFDLHKLF